jgi:hypothetical protein
MAIEQIRQDWYAGYEDGKSARPAEPGPRDRLSYLSGWIAGESARLEALDAAGQDPGRQPEPGTVAGREPDPDQ